MEHKHPNLKLFRDNIFFILFKEKKKSIFSLWHSLYWSINFQNMTASKKKKNLDSKEQKVKIAFFCYST